MSKPTSASPAAGAPAAQRRRFLAGLAAGVIGTIVAVVPTIPGIAFLLHPLLKKKKAGAAEGDGYVKITTVEAIPKDGSPRAFPVQMDIQDAWNKYPDRQVGSVFLSRNEDGQLKCFSCVCPHLGCTINYEEKAKLYLCPCHASSFKLDGERENQIPPRSMDPLEVRVNEKNEVEVKYQTFRAGTSERKVVS
ncbi:Cytochrome b6-f complex iron-sulfur subunit [Caulifigura coniformis]|uniref:Cytochrome b6-f complex iron-sulfur subunit n=1 Tax=Caulifigura coniformis TaxID=2527983 RepID=A0A517SA25_9PLAN|nr:Rieske (2Fe-2S) protein [Caulifigura coniformis]QDT52979.1 Cytochrome b6-f complex iron-sulfur subunit [Caulifigura coniformis]